MLDQRKNKDNGFRKQAALFLLVIGLAGCSGAEGLKFVETEAGSIKS